MSEGSKGRHWPLRARTRCPWHQRCTSAVGRPPSVCRSSRQTSGRGSPTVQRGIPVWPGQLAPSRHTGAGLSGLQYHTWVCCTHFIQTLCSFLKTKYLSSQHETSLFRVCCPLLYRTWKNKLHEITYKLKMNGFVKRCKFFNDWQSYCKDASSSNK